MSNKREEMNRRSKLEKDREKKRKNIILLKKETKREATERNNRIECWCDCKIHME